MRTQRRAASTGRTRAALGLYLGLVLVVAAIVGSRSGAGAVPSPSTGPPTADGPTAAGLAAAWVAVQVDAGLPLQVFGGDDWGATTDAGAALAAAGAGGDRAARIWSALIANRETVVAPDDGSGSPGPFADDPGRLAKVILFARALGTDPRAVGAVPGADLVARLQATIRTTGPEAGLFGSGAPTFDGSFRQGLVLQALSAVGVVPDAAAVSWLTAQQCANGAWMSYRANLAVPCPTDGFPGPETNGSASAIVGLTVSNAAPAAVQSALDWLAGIRNPDGGWGFVVGSGTDPNSTAGVVQALVTAGVADQQRFAGGLGALLSFQLGCAAPTADRGAFTFPDTGGAPNLFATVQAVPAALGVAAPVPGGDPVTSIPVVDCTATPTSTVPTSTVPTSTVPTSTVPTSTTAAITSTTSGTGSTSVVAPVPLSPVDPEVLGVAVTNPSGNASSINAGSRGSSGGSGLALTGADAGSVAVAGVVLVLAGAVTMGLRRRTAHR